MPYLSILTLNDEKIAVFSFQHICKGHIIHFIHRYNGNLRSIHAEVFYHLPHFLLMLVTTELIKAIKD